MYFEIVKAEYLDSYKVQLTFKNGRSGIADLASYPDPTNVFIKFLDLSYFMDFKIEFGTLIWGDGELDIAPEHLYQITTGEEVVFNLEQNAG